MLSVIEGVSFSKGTTPNFPMDTRIEPIKYGTPSNTDSSNWIADTRAFGTKNDILNGDGTLSKNVHSLSYVYNDIQVSINAYKSAIESIKDGNRFNPFIPKCPVITYNAIMQNMLDMSKTDEELITYFQRRMYEFKKQYDMSKEKYERTVNYDGGDNDKLPRYDVGLVPGTDVKVIALFKFNDFNFSDAIKNGNLRQGDITDIILNNNKSDREVDSKLYGKGNALKKINTSYDNGSVIPDIETNFSLSGVDGNTHYKQQFKSRDAYNSDASFNSDDKSVYGSVTQFMDKSILVARYALSKENIKVDYVVPAPSSSKFNKYYALNLSRKLGAEYKEDFFVRNILNVYLDERIYDSGLPSNVIETTKSTIKNAALNEVSSCLMDFVKEFVKDNYGILGNISTTHYGREKVDFGLLCEFLRHYSFYGLCNINDNRPTTRNLYMYLVNHFMDYAKIKTTKRDIDVEYIWTKMLSILKVNLSKKYQVLLKNLDEKIREFSDIFKKENGGWKLSYSKKFKITDIDIKARQFVKDAYVIADSELDIEKNLFERYRNGNFLIIDEDMNSGATLKLLIDALKDKLVGHVGYRGRRARIKSNQITCLVNGYTLK